jgi:hypothetical protein
MGLFDSDNSMDAMLRQLEKNRGLYNAIKLPEYKEYSPELYNPESATAQLTSEDPVVKSKQLEALSKLSDLSSEGLSDADVAGFAKAQSVGNQVARQGTQAALQNAAQRGISGSGLEFALRDSANQDAAERAQQAGLEQAAARSNQRNQYLQAYAGQLGQTRDQNYRADAGNSNVLNQFNMANTQARNQAGQLNTANKNDAFQYNQGLKDKNYQNEIGRADRIAGMNTQQGQMEAADAEARRRRQQAMAGMAGGVIGGAFGGPAGAAVGSGIGSAIA